MCTSREKPEKKKLTINTNENKIIKFNKKRNTNIVNNTNIKILPKKSELYIYYESKKMPENGWMQCCFKCDLFTSKTLIFREEEDRIYKVYVCNSCKKTLCNKKDNIRFRDRCNKFIEKRFADIDLY
jgi:hypothetical protein